MIYRTVYCDPARQGARTQDEAEWKTQTRRSSAYQLGIMASVRQVLQSYGNKVASERVEASVFAQVAPVDYRPFVSLLISLSFFSLLLLSRPVNCPDVSTVCSFLHEGFLSSIVSPCEKIITEMPIE